jgi:hypothetical protein
MGLSFMENQLPYTYYHWMLDKLICVLNTATFSDKTWRTLLRGASGNLLKVKKRDVISASAYKWLGGRKRDMLPGCGDFGL